MATNNYQQTIEWQSWLPNKGNVIFTVFMIAITLWAQSAGAIILGATTATNSTTTFPYQGYLTDADDKPLDGPHAMTFKLYSQPSGDSALWTEQYNGNNRVQIDDGLFNVTLGSLNAIPQSVTTNNGALFLGIAIDNDSELTPRVRVDWFEREQVTDMWYVSPTASAITPLSTDWTNTPETTLTLSLSKPAQIFLTYSINVHSVGDPGTATLSTRLDVNGTPYESTGSHYQPFSPDGSNVNLNGHLVLKLDAGEHTVQLQWRSSNKNVRWQNDPAWSQGYGGARTITALAFYR